MKLTQLPQVKTRQIQLIKIHLGKILKLMCWKIHKSQLGLLKQPFDYKQNKNKPKTPKELRFFLCNKQNKCL